MIASKLILAIAVTLTLISCPASAGRGTPELTVLTKTDCPIVHQNARELALIPALLVPFITSLAGNFMGAGVDSVVAALTKDRPTTLSASEPVAGFIQYTDTGPAISPSLRCIIAFVTVRNDNGMVRADAAGLSAWLEQQRTRLGQGKTGEATVDKFRYVTKLQAPPAFYAEFVMKIAPIKKRAPAAIAFVPVLMSYSSFVGRDHFLASSRRDFLFTLGVSQPGQKDPFLSYSVNKDSILVSEFKGEAYEGHYVWQPFPSALFQLPSDAATNELFDPVNVTASFVETTHPNLLSQALGVAARDQKSALVETATTQVNQTVSPEAATKAYLSGITEAQEGRPRIRKKSAL